MMFFVFLLLGLIALVDSVDSVFNRVSSKQNRSNYLITALSAFINWFIAGIENHYIWIGHF